MRKSLPTPDAEHKTVFSCLQAGRAFAAILVLLFHNSLYIFVLDKYWGADPSLRLFNFGHAGVNFFFVLSGFIILHVHWRDIGQPSRAANFIKKRFIRIYPLYWLLLALIVPIYFLVPSFGFDYHREMGTILSSILLVYFNEDMRSELAIAWTLYHEVLFYAVFALCILHRRAGLTLMAVWLFASVVSACMDAPPFPMPYLGSYLHLLFGMGMAVCWAFHRQCIKTPAVLALSGLLIFLSAGWEENYVTLIAEKHRNLLFGLGSAFMIAGCLELERLGRFRTPAIFRLIGDASYAIYLTHFTLLSLLAKIFIRLGAKDMLPALVSYILIAFCTIAIGILLHLYVEKPLLRWLHQRAWRNTPRFRVAATPV